MGPITTVHAPRVLDRRDSEKAHGLVLTHRESLSGFDASRLRGLVGLTSGLLWTRADLRSQRFTSVRAIAAELNERGILTMASNVSRAAAIAVANVTPIEAAAHKLLPQRVPYCRSFCQNCPGR
jgi:hypothetical protein